MEEKKFIDDKSIHSTSLVVNGVLVRDDEYLK